MYLLTTSSEAEDTIFDVLMHGVGAYFIGKGLFVALSVWQAVGTNERLDRIIEAEAMRHSRETEPR